MEDTDALSVAQVCHIVQRELHNTGRALLCPICQATYQDAVRLPCHHAYCRDCLQQALRITPKCPLCQGPAQRRSIQEAPHLQQLAKIYKMALRHFGLAPVRYEPALPMTQIASQSASQSMPANTQDERDMHQTAMVFLNVLQDGPLREEQRGIVQSNQQNVKPTWTQLALESTIQAAADQEWEDAQDEDDEEAAAAEEQDAAKAHSEDQQPSEPPNPSPIVHKSPENHVEDEADEMEEQVLPAMEPAQEDEEYFSAEDDSQIPYEEFCAQVPQQPALAEVSMDEKDTKNMTVSTVNTTLTCDSPVAQQAQQDAPDRPPRTLLEDTESSTRPNNMDDSSQNSSPSVTAPPNLKNQDSSSKFTSPSTLRVSFAAETTTIPSRQPENQEPAVNQKDEDSISSDEQDDFIENAALPESTESQMIMWSTPVETFPVGTLVQVQPRTWPGMNRPGGVGRITKVSPDGTYHVRYVLGGGEKNVDRIFLTMQQQDNTEDPEEEASRNRRSTRPASIPRQLLDQLAAEGFDTVGQELHSNENQPPQRKQATRRKVARPRAPSSRPVSNRKRTKSTRVTTATAKPPKRTRRAAQNPATTQRRERPAAPTETPRVTDAQAMDVARSRYQQHIQDAMNMSVVQIVTSSLSEAELQLLGHLVRRLARRVKVTERVTKQTMICLLPPDPQCATISGRRTLKAMQCAMLGVPLVSSGWIQECIEAGKVVPPQEFLWTLPCSINDNGNNRVGMARLVANLPVRALEHLDISVCGKIPAKKLTDIRTLVKQGGGTFLSSSMLTAADPTKLVVLCEGKVPSTLPEGSRVVDTCWLFDSISCGEQLSVEAYPPTGACR